MAFATLTTARSLLGSAAAASTSTQVPASLVDCTQSAVGFFGSIRLPSTLLAGSALATLFSLTNVDSCKRSEKAILDAYHGVSFVAFLMAVISIVTTTIATTSLLLGKHNAMAADTYHFLKREFNFEFVLTRWSFLTSLMSFLTSVGLRTLFEFKLLKRPRLAGSFGCLFGGILAFLIAHINRTLNCWPNLFLMTCEVLQLGVQRLKGRPMGLLSSSLIASSILLAGMEVFAKQKED